MPTVPGLTALLGTALSAADLFPVDQASGPTLKSIRADKLLQGLLATALIANALVDANGNEYIKLGTTASAVNEVTVTNNATGSGPLIAATGGDTNVPISLDGKGSGAVNLNATGTGAVKIGTQLQLPSAGIIQDANANELIKFAASVASAINEITVTNAAAGNGPLIAVTGGDTNAPLSVDAKGSGVINLNVTGTGAVKIGTQLQLKTAGIIQDAGANELIKFPATVASAVNEITVSNAATGSAPSIASTGGDTDIDLTLTAKGAGTLKTAFGLVSSSATKALGYSAGAGGTVTQATNRSTGVTLSKPTGAITTDTTSLAAGASATFTVTNTLVAINDVVSVSVRSGQTNKETRVSVSAVAAGSFDITVHNTHASVAEVGAIVVNYVLQKGAVA